MAVLAAADLILDKISPTPEMYSFAGPRVANPDFANSYNAACPASWRAVNTEDVVPTVPLAVVSSKIFPDLVYQHVGKPVDFTTQNGSVSGNHHMEAYCDALGCPGAGS